MTPQLAEAIVLLVVVVWLGRLYARRPSRVLPFLASFLLAPAVGLALQGLGFPVEVTTAGNWLVVATTAAGAVLMVVGTWSPSARDVREVEMLTRDHDPNICRAYRLGEAKAHAEVAASAARAWASAQDEWDH